MVDTGINFIVTAFNFLKKMTIIKIQPDIEREGRDSLLSSGT